MHDLTAFQRDVLYVLAGLDEAYGLKIKSELEDYYGGEVNHGRLYPNLDDLVDCDFVDKGQIDRRTNSYELTADGREALDARRNWENEYLEEQELAAP
jgi:PadR family transcriptional regulator PadR